MLTFKCQFEQIYVFTCLLYSLGESVGQSDGGRLFHRGAMTEKARCPSLLRIRTVMAAEILSVKVDRPTSTCVHNYCKHT